VPYLSASAVMINYEEALYQVYAPLSYLYLNDRQTVVQQNGIKMLYGCTTTEER